MEWSISNENAGFVVDLIEIEEGLSVTSISKEGSKKRSPQIFVFPDDKPGRVIVNVEGKNKISHIARFEDTWWVHLNGRSHEVTLHEKGGPESLASEGSLTAPMPGTVLETMVKKGQRVRNGQALMILEAMKMEHRVLSPIDGEVTIIHYSEGDKVSMGDTLLEIID